MFGHRKPPPRWVRPALLIILACAGLLYCWGMGGGEYNSFYASAARSMSENWKAFLFGSFSPANSITIDKIPGYLWPQALSARVFGFRAWSLVLPQIIEAVVTLLTTYRLVRRWAGECAAVLAAAFLVLTPALVAVAHTNNEEAAYVMCLALAASATQRATVTGRLRSLLAAGVWVGLAFQCKMVEAWAVVPVIAVTYLVSAPPRLRRRLLHMVAAGLVTLAVSLSWVVIVSLVPASGRPYIDGTTNNNPFSMVFGYNALTRFSSLGISPASVGAVSQAHGGVAAGGGAAGAIPSSGLATMFESAQASQVGWLYPLAAVAIAVLLWQRRRQPRTDPVRAGVILWTAWIVVYGLAYSSGTIHTYYVVTLAPALAALSGAGAVALWRAYRSGGRRAWALPITLALTDAWAIRIAASFPSYRTWLIPVLAAAGIVALGALAVKWPRPTAQRSPAAHRVAAGPRAVLAVGALGLLAVSVGPAAWDSSVMTAGDDVSLAMGNVGPNAPGASPFGAAGGRVSGHSPFGAAGGSGSAGAGAGAAGGGAAGGLGGMWVTDGTLTTQQRDLLGYVQAHRDGARFVLTVPTTFQATPYILRDGADILSLGGFSGQVPYPSLSQFEQYVASGQVRYVYLATFGGPGGSAGSGGSNGFGGSDRSPGPGHSGESGGPGGSGGRGGSGGSGVQGGAEGRSGPGPAEGQGRSQGSQTAAAQIEAWVPSHCTTVPASEYGGATTGTSSGTLYLCAGD